MADMTKGLKDIWMKGMETISDTANRIAVNTRQKVNEMNIVNRRAEIMKDLGRKAYAMWQQGDAFPAEMDALMRELHQLDTELNEIRNGKSAPAQEETCEAEAADEAADEIPSEVEAPAVPVMTVDAEEAAPAPEAEDSEVSTIHVEE